MENDNIIKENIEITLDILIPNSKYLSEIPDHSHTYVNDIKVYAPSLEFLTILAWNVFLPVCTIFVSNFLYDSLFRHRKKILENDEIYNAIKELESILSNEKVEKFQVKPDKIDEMINYVSLLLINHGWPVLIAKNNITEIVAETIKKFNEHNNHTDPKSRPKNDIQENVGKGNTTEALEIFEKHARYLKLPGLINDTILLKSRFNQISKQKNLGIVSNEEYRLETVKINYAILYLLNQI